jgi:hypothetical protein
MRDNGRIITRDPSSAGVVSDSATRSVSMLARSARGGDANTVGATAAPTTRPWCAVSHRRRCGGLGEDARVNAPGVGKS